MDTPRDALADGRLADAIPLQAAAVRAAPADPAARLFLAELLALAGRLADARDELLAVASDAPDWPAARRRFVRLLKAEHRRSHRGRPPEFVADPPAHARRRWRVVRAVRAAGWDAAAAAADRADALSPVIAGHLDGREFHGLRDADDRFASVLEVFSGADYLWLPWEAVRRVTLAPPAGALDAAFRPARVRLAGGADADVVLPLLYPGSGAADGAFAAGLDTDWAEAGGLLCGVGARVLFAGDEEVPLGEVRQLELRPG